MFCKLMKEAIELPNEDIVSIDGKTMRGTIEEGSTKGVHIVSAICKSYGLVVGQVKRMKRAMKYSNTRTIRYVTN